MKKIVFLTLSLILTNTYAQNFTIQKNTGRADLSICQKNHVLILDAFINQADGQAARLMNGISIEKVHNAKEEDIKRYERVLIEILTKKIVLTEIKKQLNSKNLHKFYSERDNYNKDVLDPDNIQIDLSQAIKTSIDQIKNHKKMDFSKHFLDKLKKDLVKETALLLVSQRYRAISAGLLSRIITGQSGKIATEAVLKSATVSFTSKLFVSVGTGLLLDLLTFPLHGYRLPPETLWLDLLAENPEIVIVPEWMRKGGVNDHPWTTHCNTIQRETKRLKKLITDALKADEAGVQSSVRAIFNSYSRIERDLPDDNNGYYNPVKIDNTYVHKNPVLLEVLGPFWMRH